MIGRDTATEGIALLGTAIAEIFEDCHSDALKWSRDISGATITQVRVLGSAGQDVAALAAAMDVLARRAEPEG